MPRTEAATIAFAVTAVIAGCVQLAWAHQMARLSAAQGRYFQQVTANPHQTGPIEDDAEHRAANRALDRLRPLDIASRVVLIFAAYYLGVTVLTR
ncbi:hypothetical protein ABZT26_35190 [Streptomyces sp. NPDC005395]|uniref:hypothetical protein n=1 Tax=Streptomyces sp. NPDC005395 TaxID=3157042 RepID=UPI0033A68E34